MENFYLAFSDGQIFHCPAMTKRTDDTAPSLLPNTSGGAMILPLEEEHTDLGRALVDALWFSHPVKVVVEQRSEQERSSNAVRRNTYQARVHRCHIVGPVFQQALLEVRAENQDRDMASAWEIHLLEETETIEVSRAKQAGRSKVPELHLDHPLFHFVGQTALH